MIEQAKADSKKITGLYSGFILVIALTALPYIWAAGLSLIGLITILFCAYRWKKQFGIENFIGSHSAFIISSIWAAGLLSVISVAAASVYMLPAIDYTAFNPCAQTLANKGVAFAESAGFNDIWPLAQPCIHNFITANFSLLVQSAVIAITPVALYIIYRLGRGIPSALKGQPVKNPTRWF
jgi:uncharacterized membrane protein